MADLTLVFGRPRYAGGPIDLVFGGSGGDSPALPSTISGTITNSVSVASGTASYDNKNPRTAGYAAKTHFKKPTPAEKLMASTWGETARRASEPSTPWKNAERIESETAAVWIQAQVLRRQWAVAWRTSKGIETILVAPHRITLRHERQAAGPWGVGVPMDRVIGAPFLRASTFARHALVAADMARGLEALVLARHAIARAADKELVAPWGIGRPLPPGLSILPDPDDVPFVPRVIDLNLIFCHPAYVGGPIYLVFGRACELIPPAAILIPTRSTYVVQNNVTFYRLPSGLEFEASNFNLDIDTDSWTFGWSASLPIAARLHLVRSAPRERVEVDCVVNGVHLRLTVDGMGRDRSFPEDRIAVRGRGLAAELDDATLSFGNTAARTAQQLMADVLTVNGVSIGWGIDWQIDDWLVPANAWLMQGTYINALQDIAGAAGAYLQPHFTDKVLRVLPRYAKAPWYWATELAVDIELPVAATSVVNTEEVMRPDYNRVFVGGVAMGVFGPVTRDGTAGETDAPPIAHPLITASEVHRQRGVAELSNTGLQLHHSIKTMVWPETGIIMPGKVLRYTSEDGPELGIVRKTNVNMSQWPAMHQTLGVETHVE